MFVVSNVLRAIKSEVQFTYYMMRLDITVPIGICDVCRVNVSQW